MSTLSFSDQVRLVAANYGQEAGWSVFLGDEHVCDLVEPHFVEMYWVGYRLVPVTDPERMYEVLEKACYEPGLVEFRSRMLSDVRLMDAMLGGLRGMRETGCVSVRRLRFVPTGPLAPLVRWLGWLLRGWKRWR